MHHSVLWRLWTWCSDLAASFLVLDISDVHESAHSLLSEACEVLGDATEQAKQRYPSRCDPGDEPGRFSAPPASTVLAHRRDVASSVHL